MGFEPLLPSSSGGSPGGGLSAQSLGMGLLTYGPGQTVNADTLSAQEMFVVLCTAPVTKTISILGTWITQAGATPGAGVNLIGLYSEAGTLLTQSADMTTVFQSIGVAEQPCTPVAVIGGTNYYLGVVCNFTLTAPKIPYCGVNNVPGINGHFPMLFHTSIAALPASFVPSSWSPGFDSFVMWAR